MIGLTPPISGAAPADKRIRGAPLAAYWFILQRGLLGFVEFTELKSTAIEKGLDINERTARYTIQILVSAGYLEEGARSHPTAPGRYRLRWGGGSVLPNSSGEFLASRVP